MMGDISPAAEACLTCAYIGGVFGFVLGIVAMLGVMIFRKWIR